MRVLVTGGCGFVGSAIVRMAVERGDHVLNIDRRRKSNPVPALGPIANREGYARLEADVTDRGLMRAVVREFTPDAIIHLATPGEAEPAAMLDGEIGGAFSIAEAARAWFEAAPPATRARFRLVHIERAEPDLPGPLTPQQALAGTAASLLDRWSRATGAPLVTCVAGDAFGPWQPRASLMARVLASLLHDQPVTLPNAGADVRDWLPIRDLAAGVLAAASSPDVSGRIDFSVGAERRDIDIAESLCALLDERLPAPGGKPWFSRIATAGHSRTSASGPMLDQLEAERLLGWAPHGFHAGLDRMISWAVASHQAVQARRTAVAAE